MDRLQTTPPQRMGAALTHARRYALFTLVGIAGDDDLDAPDLCVEPSVLPSEVPAGGQSWMPRRPGSGSARKGLKSEHPPTLDPDQSGAFRDKLLTEVKNATSADCAAGWAREALAASQQMPRLVEDAFKRRLSGLSQPETTELPSRDLAVTKVTKDFSRRNGAEPRGIDKSVLAVAAPRRYRNKEHLRFVAQQPCLLCARKPSDPHHFDSSNHGRWAARPATSSRFRFAGHTTGR
jgi:ERF superfamily